MLTCVTPGAFGSLDHHFPVHTRNHTVPPSWPELPRADVDILTFRTVVMGNNVNQDLAFSLHFQRVRQYRSITEKKLNPSEKITA